MAIGGILAVNHVQEHAALEKNAVVQGHTAWISQHVVIQAAINYKITASLTKDFKGGDMEPK